MQKVVWKYLFVFQLPIGLPTPQCTKECLKSCISGSEFCYGMKINNDDKAFLNCACHKSTIVRAPGLWVSKTFFQIKLQFFWCAPFGYFFSFLQHNVACFAYIPSGIRRLDLIPQPAGCISYHLTTAPRPHK